MSCKTASKAYHDPVLKEGDKVPATLLRAAFESIGPGSDEPTKASLAELAPAGKTLVLFFYPKDSTPGCTTVSSAFSFTA